MDVKDLQQFIICLLTVGQPMLLFFLNARENNEMRIILALVSNPGLDRATIPRPVRKTRPRKVWR